MARLARIVIPGVPHHVTQRGNRRMDVFFSDDDYQAYIHLLKDAARKSNTQVWAYCLMPNHVHLILVPSHKDGLRATLGEAHRQYTRRINARNKWTGHLWQGRFGSVPMDEDHLLTAVRYVSLNPVRAKLVERAEDWAWSSVRAHLAAADDALVEVSSVLSRVQDFKALIEDDEGGDDERFKQLRQGETIGRPIGSDNWLASWEKKLDLQFRTKKRGPKGKVEKEG